MFVTCLRKPKQTKVVALMEEESTNISLICFVITFHLI
jgi:hypothetical protein